jgi:hypothetical protein
VFEILAAPSVEMATAGEGVHVMKCPDDGQPAREAMEEISVVNKLSDPVEM